MRSRLIYLLLLLVLFGTAFGLLLLNYSQMTKTVAVQPTPTISQENVWSAVQMWRSNRGLEQYREDELLCKYAAIRVEQIKTDFSHDRYLSEVSPAIYQENPKLKESAENLSTEINNASQVLNKWLNSPSHRKNLDAPFTDSCIRCSDNNCVQLFAR